MESINDLTIWIAFWAGVLSFISPCTLPLYPAYLSYITGISVQDIKDTKSKQVRFKVVTHTVFFLLGVSSVYFAIGLSATLLGNLFIQYRDVVQNVSGVLLIIMGLFLVGILKVDWLMQEKRYQFSKKPVGYFGSLFIGVGFAAGWTPCIGPIMTLIISLSSSNPSLGTWYISMFILGFALPFLLFSFFIGSTKWILKYSNLIMKVGGAMMILMGILLVTDQLFVISSYIQNLIQGTWFDRLG
ncbi:cytochrome c biogenesis CcdA family protein [Bacillus horti]|uniref:Cytochrome c-type biogenesis protein n=1 Tax=Caldalkalibacillus horti TaxID=77523 RepID=A0ABT9W0W3_9BACI|nr:cytochrome c biogenesis protein CcdA [Bacillus horti]MDQ0166898.1 cytochrome c-type biogenesis protein [Bacillus horti]